MASRKKASDQRTWQHVLDIVNAANKYDRFKLIDDYFAPESDLDNDIHPILRCSNFVDGKQIYRNMRQALQLTSMFFQHDSVLEWFVAPLLGRMLQSNEHSKEYLSNPLANKSKAETKKLIDEVRKALHCLSRCIQFSFEDLTDACCYAKTFKDENRQAHLHNSACTKHFKSDRSVRIEIRKQYRNFYLKEYNKGSICDKFRHDFHFAVTIGHEICHAVGVMRRSNHVEPKIRFDHPEKPEFGFAWENFMFGGILNPCDKTSDDMKVLLWKIWSDPKATRRAGYEWTTVPASYIAQWFRKDTWDTIAKEGPTAIRPPHVELKIAYYRTHFVVMSDHEGKLTSIQAYKDKMSKKFDIAQRTNTQTESEYHAAHLELWVRSEEQLQTWHLSPPSRTPPREPSYGPSTVVTRPKRPRSESGPFSVAAWPKRVRLMSKYSSLASASQTCSAATTLYK